MRVYEVGKESNEVDFKDYEWWDEFLPYVRLDVNSFKKYNSTLDEPVLGEEVKTFSDTLNILTDEQKKVYSIITYEDETLIPLVLERGSDKNKDDDGIIEVLTDKQVKGIKFEQESFETSVGESILLKITKTDPTFEDEIELRIVANDDLGTPLEKGEQEDVLCGRVIVRFIKKNVIISNYIRNSVAYKIFSSTQMGKDFINHFKYNEEGNKLIIKSYGRGHFSMRIIKSGQKSKILFTDLKSGDLDGEFSFEYEIACTTGEETGGDGAVTFGHEAFIHGLYKIKKIEKLVKNEVKGDRLINQLIEIHRSSHIIRNGKIFEPKSGGGAADHAKILKGTDYDMQQYIKQAIQVAGKDYLERQIKDKRKDNIECYKNDPDVVAEAKK